LLHGNVDFSRASLHSTPAAFASPLDKRIPQSYAPAVRPTLQQVPKAWHLVPGGGHHSYIWKNRAFLDRFFQIKNVFLEKSIGLWIS
jgi:hypothetical protein